MQMKDTHARTTILVQLGGMALCLMPFIFSLITCSSLTRITPEPISKITTPSPLATVHGSLPVVSGEEELSTFIRERVTAQHRDFIDELSVNEEARLRTSDMPSARKPEYSFDVAWKAGRHDQDYVSILLDMQWYAGGAHGNGIVESFTWNVKQKRLVSLSEILPLTGYDTLDALARQMRQELSAKLNPDNNNVAAALITEGTDPRQPDNYRVFITENDGVTFFFQRYQVAAGYAGTPSVKISQ